MKVILVPGITIGLKRTDASKSSMSLGPLVLDAILDNMEIDNEIVDIDVMIEKKKWTFSSELYKKIAKELLLKEATVFGFYVAIGTLHHAVNIARELKRQNKNIKIFLGGPHATSTHEEIMSNFKEIDFIMRGESEKTTIEVMQVLQNGQKLSPYIKGITYREGKEIHINQDRELLKDLDEAPMPAYYKYSFDKEVLDIIPIDVGRGCPYKCTFCSTSIFWRHSYRLKSVERIVQEMRYVKKMFGARKVFLMHDCLTANKKTLRELCKRLEKENLNLQWGCAARLDHLDKKTLEMLKEGGCTHLELGIESGSDNVRKSINKSLDIKNSNDVLIERLEEMHNMGFSLILFFMCGFSNETEEDLSETLSLIGKCLMAIKGNGFFRLTFLELFPGTPIYEEQKKVAIFDEKLLSKDSCNMYGKALLKIAKQSNLFPEFYYVKNENNIDNSVFREASSLYSSFIKVMGTEMYYCFYVLMKCFDGDIRQIEKCWIIFENHKKEKYREMSLIMEHMIEFISYIQKKNVISGISYLIDLANYEMLSYQCRQQYLKNWNKNKGEKNGPVRNNILIKVLEYDIPKLIQYIKNSKELPQNIMAQETIILAQPVYSEQIKIIRISKPVMWLLELCTGDNSVNVITKKIKKYYPTCEKKEIEKIIKNLYQQGLIV